MRGFSTIKISGPNEAISLDVVHRLGKHGGARTPRQVRPHDRPCTMPRLKWHPRAPKISAAEFVNSLFATTAIAPGTSSQLGSNQDLAMNEAADAAAKAAMELLERLNKGKPPHAA